ncbi:MAG TPA: zinc ribbon domain-containing protein [Vicinamibacteria bacterium]|nr:zinc ribbon domain-containing protein [Vicinamibacteria bacterium]
MPIYEYRCKTCEQEFEALILGKERASCPFCESSKLEKLLSTFSALTVSAGSLTSRELPQAPCGACGDPRGPGACSRD